MGQCNKSARTEGPANGQQANPATVVKSHPTRTRRWLFRVAVMVAVPAVILATIEASLRLAGYGYPTAFFIRAADGQHYTSNRQFGWQYYPRRSAIVPHPILMPATKAPGTRRIFVLGESAAAGTPDPAFGFARILEVMLADQYPGTRFEVINAAMRGIDSHIILPIAQECARHQPDLFILHLGNNEFIGLIMTQPNTVRLIRHRHLRPVVRWIRSTRLAQLVESMTSKVLSAEPGKGVTLDMDFFRRQRLAPDDPQRKAIYENFQANLAGICDAARDSGAVVIGSTVAVNLSDCPPLGSLHRAHLATTEQGQWEKIYAEGIEAEKNGRWETAIERYRAAARVDESFADLQFRLARCYLACGEVQKAREHYGRARDCDALQFRTDSRRNEIIRRSSSGKVARGIYFADLERAFAGNSLAKGGVPGRELFYDHVHFTFDGDYLAAQTLLPQVAAALRLGAAVGPLPSRQQCADRLGFTRVDEVNVTEPMVNLTAKPPFTDQLDHAETQSRAEQLLNSRRENLHREDLERAVQVDRQAVADRPHDWQLRYNFARLLRNLNDYGGAAEQFERALEIFPNLLPAKLGLGYVCLEAGRPDEAIRHFADAIRIDPHSRPAWQALGQAGLHQQAQKTNQTGQSWEPLPSAVR